MEVMSIADYDRAHESEGNMITGSAVDQLAVLAQSSSSGLDATRMMFSFGNLTVEDDVPLRRFEFDPPTTYKQWPGPRYGESPLHKPKMRSSLRKHRQSDDLRQSPRPKKSLKPKKTTISKGIVQAPMISGRVEPRNPPLHLLSLPAEIRNLIWSLLAVRSRPVEAQLRPIHSCRKLSSRKGRTISRFPREPGVAAVCRQLRKEVLSIFYGTNVFIFEKNACSMFKQYGMLSPVMMRRWQPRDDVAHFLANIDVRFNVLPTLAPMMTVVYKLRRLANENTTVSVTLDNAGYKQTTQADTEYCLCAEHAVVKAVSGLNCEGDLTTLAAAVFVRRFEMLFKNPATPKRDVMRPSKGTCDECGNVTFDAVYSGI